MLGFLFALLCFIVKMIKSGLFREAFLSATNFLFWWCLVWMVLFFVTVFIVAVLVMTAGILNGATRKEKLKIVFNTFYGYFGLGSAFAPVAVKFLLKKSLLICGAFLLNKSVIFSDTSTAWCWDVYFLSLGTVFILATLFYKARFLVRTRLFLKYLYEGGKN